MQKVITVCIDEQEISTKLRRVKKKEIKELAEKLVLKLEEALEYVRGGDFVKTAPGFIAANIDFICEELILPFVGLKPEQIDEMDAADIAGLLGEMLAYNGIDKSKIMDFLRNAGQTINTAGIPANQISFQGIAIPEEQ